MAIQNKFNKGFRKIIRWIISVKVKWYKYEQKIKIKFDRNKSEN